VGGGGGGGGGGGVGGVGGMIVCAPVNFSAAVYLALSSGIRSCSVKLVPLRARTVVIVFFVIDVLTTILQVAGAALIGTAESARVQNKKSFIAPDQANDILLAGLAIQTASFFIFFLVLSKALYTSAKSSASDALSTRFSLVISITSFLIFLRTTYRLAETAQGIFGTASSSETLFATHEYLPIILAVWIWAANPIDILLPNVEGAMNVSKERA